MECIAVCAIADDSPISYETGPVAEGVCSIGIVVCVLCVNVFIVIEELWEWFETVLSTYLVYVFLGCFMQLLWLEECGRGQSFII